jgi:hypothetical protein
MDLLGEFLAASQYVGGEEEVRGKCGEVGFGLGVGWYVEDISD